MSLRVLIVSENISLNMGGESSLPFYYAKLLQQRGVEVFLACHDRVAKEIEVAFSDLGPRIHLVEDSSLQKALFRLGEKLGNRVKVSFTEQLIHIITQSQIQKIARKLATEQKIDAVFEPAPITPKGLSFMHNVGVPVVIGPLCGGMNFPPAFADMDSKIARLLMKTGRWLANFAHKVAPGKLYADIILVANLRTARALPAGVRGRVLQLFESGVDLDLWRAKPGDREIEDRGVRFVYSGSFTDLKGIPFLVSAFARVAEVEPDCELHLIGGGDLDQVIRSQVKDLGLEQRVTFHGWVDRPEAARILRDSDVFVMPSLRECGGTAVLEAMALGKPVIVTRWGGLADYVTPDCGILVEPTSKQGFVDGLTEAMARVAESPDLRRAMGAGGKARVLEDHLDWGSKADRVLQIIGEAAEQNLSLSLRGSHGISED